MSEVIASVSRRFEDTARFEGIQGEVSGELFGIENMLQFEVGDSSSGVILTRNRKEAS